MPIKAPPPVQTSQEYALELALFAFLCRKYVQRSDQRQRRLGLQYMGAETSDLAKELARFIAKELNLTTHTT